MKCPYGHSTNGCVSEKFILTLHSLMREKQVELLELSGGVQEVCGNPKYSLT